MFINNFDPVAFNILSFEIRWYSLAYIFGILFGWFYCKKFLIRDKIISSLFDDLVTYLIIGIIVGGRLGYVLIYNIKYYLNNVIEILFIWEGGMSFHGGLIGIFFATYLFSRKHKINKYIFLDLISVSAPIGIFFGRIANFINGELIGKATNGSWGIIFPKIDSIPRHPSQLYESFLEGIILFIILNIIFFKKEYKTGTVSFGFLIFYGIFRFISEFFREPDIQIGYIIGSLSMGMTLSLLMIFFGLILYKINGTKT
jgi:phosphatidylglycerol:prolipoprotein diacylglycerol transferase